MQNKKFGAHERHLLRKSNNPLFGYPTYTPGDRENARLADQNERTELTIEIQQLAMRCLQLGESTESETILVLKQQLDKLFERSCGLAGDVGGEQTAIQTLLAPIMRAIEKNAATDPKALQKLSDEKIAQEMHRQYLKNPLLCDLLRPDTSIGDSELIATLLSEASELMTPVLAFFDDAQLALLVSQGHKLLTSYNLDPDHNAHVNLASIEEHLTQRVTSI